MPIKFYTIDRSIPKIRRKLIRKRLIQLIEAQKRRVGDISVVFCSDEEELRINQEYLNHNFYTDVITFNYNEGNLVSGDIFISLDRLRENARDRKILLTNEVHRIIVHGVLHLIGFDDKTIEQKERMTQKEDQFLLEMEAGTE